MSNGQWSWLDDTKTAIYSVGGTSKATITGLARDVTRDLSVDDNSGKITVSKEVFDGLSSGSSISLQADAYMLQLGTGLATAAAIDGTSLQLSTVNSSGSATISGKFGDYYDLASGQQSITVHKDTANRNFATISGLKANTTIQLDGETIKLDTTDLTTSNVSLSTAGTVSGVNVDNYGFNFKLYTTDNGDTLAGASLGFGADADRWTVSSNSTTAIYQSVTKQGWKLNNGGTSVTYTGESTADVASISGFNATLGILIDGADKGNVFYQSNSNQAIWAVGTASTGVTFQIATGALSASTDTPVTLTTGNGAVTGKDYTLAFKSTNENLASLWTNNAGQSVYGLSAHVNEAYWRIDGQSAIYQYNTDAGWTATGTSIYYTAAKTGDNATALAMLTGISSGINLASSSTINGVSVTGGDSTLRAVTITKADIFDRSANLKTLKFTDANPSDGIDFSALTLSGIATIPVVNYTNSATSPAVATSQSVAYIKADLYEYYSLSGTDNYVYHAAQSAQTIATITGLSAGQQVEITGSESKTLLLDRNDLIDNNVSIAYTASISGYKDYSFSLSSNVTTTPNVIDSTQSASLVSNDNKYYAYGMAEKYYTLSGTSSSVVYHAAASMALAQIIGLSNVTTENASMSTDGRTILLQESALGSGTIRLDNTKTGHDLKFQLMEGVSSVASLGGKDSGDYWTLAGGSASFVHYTKESWSWLRDTFINYTAPTTPEARLTISGLDSKFFVNGSGSTASIGSKNNMGDFVTGISISGTSVIIDEKEVIGTRTNAKVKATSAGASYAFVLKGDLGASAAVRDLKAGDGFVGMVNGLSVGEAYWSITGTGDAIYQYNTSEGWHYDDKTGDITYSAAKITTLATVKGLYNPKYVAGYTAGTSTAQIQGISVTTANGQSVIQLGASVLGSKDIELTLANNAGVSYTLGFLSATAGASTFGFGIPSGGSYAWSLNGTEATYYTTRDEGWTLGSSGTKITHTAESANHSVLAAVTGLKGGLSSGDLLSYVTVVVGADSSTAGTITLGASALNETKGTVVSIKSGSYALALAGGISNITGVSSTVTSFYTAPAYNQQTATVEIRDTLYAGWSMAGDSQSVTYHDPKSVKLATITGLSAFDSSKLTDNVSINAEDNIIGLSNGALYAAGNVTLKIANESGSDYTLKLLGDNSNGNDYKANDGKVGFSSIAYGWDNNQVAGTATYYTNNAGGWVLGSDSKSVTYSTTDSTKTTLAVINGLDKNETYAGALSISGTTISLSTALMNDSNDGNVVSLTKGEDIYKLAIANDNVDGKIGVEGFGEQAPAVHMAGTTANLTQIIENGWTLKDNAITFTAEHTLNLANITGLKTGTKTDDLKLSYAMNSGTSNYHQVTITLGASALGTGEIKLDPKTTEGEYYYQFSIDGAQKQSDNSFTSGFNDVEAKWTYEPKSDTYSYWGAGKAEGWTIDANGQIVTYTAATPKVLFTLKGLKSDSNIISNLSTYITVEEGVGGRAGTITINNADVLNDKDVVLTEVGDNNFELALGSSITPSKLNSINPYELTFTGGVNYKTATYKASYDAGYAVDSTSKKIVYTAANKKEVFKITGLDSIADKDSWLKAGTNPTPPTGNGVTTLTLRQAVLGGTNLKLTVSDDYKDKYKLAIEDATEGSIGGGVTARNWVVNGTTATYRQNIAEGWTVDKDGLNIAYSAPANNKELAKVSGLVGGLTTKETTLEVQKYLDIDGITVNDNTAAAGEKRTYTNPTADNPLVITLDASVLGASEVKVTKGSDLAEGKFVLALAETVAQEADTTANYWTVKGTTATYQNDTTPYYELDSSAEKVTYHKSKNNVLATIANVKSGTKAVASEVDKPAAIEGIVVATEPSGSNSGKIYISDEVLGTNNKAKLKLTSGSYALYLADDIATPKTLGEYWTYGATTTLKQYTPAYYTVSNNEITYNPQVAVTNSKKQAVVPIKIEGLNKEVGAEDIILFKDIKDDETAAKLFGTGTTKSDIITALGGGNEEDYANTIILTAGALTTGNVKLTNGKDKDGNAFSYKLALYEVKGPKPTTTTWKINKTTATLTGFADAGYTASADGKTITYTQPQNKATLLTISGLPTGMTLSNTTSDYKSQIEGVKIAADGSISFDKDLLDQNFDGDAKNNFSKISIKGSGFTIAPLKAKQYMGSSLTDEQKTTFGKAEAYWNDFIYTSEDEIVKGSDTVEAGVDVWRISGTTATYKRIIPAHYKIDKNGALVFVKEATAKMTVNGKKVDAIYMTITGIPNGLLEEAANGQSLVFSNDKSTKAIELDGTTVKVTEDVLSEAKKLTINDKVNAGYTFSLDSSLATQSADVWTFNKGTATLKAGKTAGWELNAATKKTAANTVLTYKGVTQSTDKNVKAIVTVKGLNTGLKVNANGQLVAATNSYYPVVTVSGNTVTLTKDAVTNSTISVNNGYTIDLSGANVSVGEPLAPSDNIYYTVSGTTLTIRNDGTSAYFVLNEDQNKATYKKPVAGKEGLVAKITGLKKGLKVKPDGTIDGVRYDNDVLYLDSQALGTSKVSVAEGDVTLQLENEAHVCTKDSATTYGWAVSGTTATLKQGNRAYYTLSSNEKEITYTKAVDAAKKGTAVAEITNLKKGLKVVKNTSTEEHVNLTNVISNGIDIYDTISATNGKPSGTFTLSANALTDDATKPITLTNKNGSEFSLALNTEDETEKHVKSTDGGQAWVVSGTTATLYKASTAGYAVTNGETKLEYSTGITAQISDDNKLATLSRLKSGLRVNTDGTIDGISIDGDKISVDSRVLGTTDVSVTKGSGAANYTLHLVTQAEDAKNGAPSGELINKCIVEGTTVTITPVQPKGYVEKTTTSGDPSVTTTTIEYKAAETKADLATIEGLKKGLKADSNGQIDGITVTTDETNSNKQIITLSSKVLGTTGEAKVTLNDSTHTTVAIASDDAAATTDETWSVKDGALILTKTVGKGYTVVGVTGDDEGKKVITYDAGSVVTTTITGLNAQDSWVNNDGKLTDTAKAYIGPKEGDSTTFEVKQLASGSDKVTITGGDYKLALGSSLNSNTGSLKWNYVGTTATLTQKIPQGNYTCDGVTITRNSGNTKYKVVATITGLSSRVSKTNNSTAGTLKVTEITNSNGTPISNENLSGSSYDGIKYTEAIKVEGNTITVKEAVLGTTGTVKLTGTGYKLELAGGVPLPATDEEPEWRVKGTTATYYPITSSAGYKVSEDGKSITYATEKLGSALAKISGLNSSVASAIADGPKEIAEYLATDSLNGNTTIKAAALGTTKVTLTDENKKDKNTYKLILSNEIATGTSLVAEPAWSVNGSNAFYYASVNSGYYTLKDGTEITYTDKTFPATASASITGLKSGIAVSNGSIKGVELESSTFSFGADVLSTTDVSISGGNYSIAVAESSLGPEVVQDSQKYVTIAGANNASTTTVKYMESVSAGYTQATGGKSLTYSAAKTQTLFEIQGLKSGLEVDNGYINGIRTSIEAGGSNSVHVFLSADVLAEGNASISQGDALIGYATGTWSYALAFADDVNTISNKTGTDWSVSGATNATAILSSVKAAYYSLASDQKSFTYTPQSVGSGLATLTGVSNLDADVNGTTTVTLYNANLDKNTPVTFTTTDSSQYKLQLGADVTLSDTTAGWTKSGTTATAKVTIAAGYATKSVSTSVTSIGYVNATTKAVATVNGVNGALYDDYIDHATENITLTGSGRLLSDKVSVNGGSDSVAANNYKFTFMNYNKATVTGSANADYVTFDGSSLKASFGAGNDVINFTDTGGNNTITGGTGDDIISLTGGGNVILYNSGDGNDSIAGLTSNDTIQIASDTVTSANVSVGSNVASIKVGEGVISISGNFNSSNRFTLINSKGENIFNKTAAPSADLLYDEEDNFFTGDEDAQLSYITNTSFHAHASNEFDDPQDLTKLTKQSSLIFYGKDKK